MENHFPAPAISYKPSVFYFRRALRAAPSKKHAVEIGRHLCAEIEQLKEWVRKRGLVPPKWNVMQAERDEKGWSAVLKFPASE